MGNLLKKVHDEMPRFEPLNKLRSTSPNNHSATSPLRKSATGIRGGTATSPMQTQ